MLLFVSGIVLVLAGVLSPLFLRNAKGIPSGIAMGTRIIAFILGLILIGLSFVCVVQPGQITLVYGLVGGRRMLSVGYNFAFPWEKRVTLNSTYTNLVFIEEGDSSNPNDAFGGQTLDGDYMTTVANISVRIDLDRIDEYILSFGEHDIGQSLADMIKGMLKDSFEKVLETYHTEEVMQNKSSIANAAAADARGRLEEILPIQIGTLTYPDIQASDDYETAIKEKAKIRMQTEQYELLERQNLQKAAADKVQADGIAAVKLVEAENAAAVKEIEAQNAAAVKEIEAENAAVVALIKADNDAAVKATQANADANVTTVTARAEAEAKLTLSEAEAKSAEQIGAAYHKYPTLLSIRNIEVSEKAVSSWNGVLPQFAGLSSFNFADLTSLISELIQVNPEIEPIDTP